MGRKSKKKNEDQIKKTALIRIADAVLFIAFDDKTVTGTLTRPDGKTQKFTCDIEEVK